MTLMSDTPRSGYSSIEETDRPLVYAATSELRAADVASGHLRQRVATRALAGMQKEALVAESSSDTVWRMVCDEGPYLNGTDLAPPPLAFFSAGMAASLGTGICNAVAGHGKSVRTLQITQDNMYTMEGSAVRGTMLAGALPVELSIAADTDLSETTLREAVLSAIGACPIDHLMRTALEDTFSLTLNGVAASTGTVRPSPNAIPEDPAALLLHHGPLPGNSGAREIIGKLEATESVFDEDHGAGAAMKDSQKRQLHLRAILEISDDGLFEIRVQIFKPIGSIFRFLAESSAASCEEPRAPHGLTYVSAGIAFCFMTQLGRYAGIMKKKLDAYGIVQDTAFDIENGTCLPVDTHSFLTIDDELESAQKIIDMGEQTCFLHGACRGSNKTRLRSVRLSGTGLWQS